MRGAVDAGAEAVLLAPGIMGLDVLQYAREIAKSLGSNMLLFSHSTFASALTRSPIIGIGAQAWVGYQRGAGADCVVLPSTGGSFGVAPADTLSAYESANSHHTVWKSSICAHSGSLNSSNWHRIRDATRSSDFILTSGAGLFDHPLGAEAGARDLRKSLGGEHVNTDWLTSWTA